MNAANPLLEKAFEVLTVFFRDPTTSYACTTSIFWACEQISTEWQGITSEARKLKMAKSHPQLLRAAIRFMTLDLSSAQRTEILKAITKCQICQACRELPLRDACPGAAEELRNHAFHAIVYPPVWAATQFLTCVLSALTQGKFRNRKEYTPSRDPEAQPWPLSVEDFLPNGLKTSVNALAFWAKPEYAGGTKAVNPMLRFAAALTTFYPPFGRELVKPPYTLLLKIPMQYFNDCLNGVISQGDVTTYFGLSSVFSLADRDGFLRMLIANRDSVLTTFERLESHVPKPEELQPSEKHRWDSTLTLVRGWSDMLRAKSTIDPKTGSVSFDLLDTMGYRRFQDFGTSFLALYKARKEGCWNFDCPGGNGGTLRLCSQCDLFHYCGPKVRHCSLLLESQAVLTADDLP